MRKKFLRTPSNRIAPSDWQKVLVVDPKEYPTLGEAARRKKFHEMFRRLGEAFGKDNIVFDIGSVDRNGQKVEAFINPEKFDEVFSLLSVKGLTMIVVADQLHSRSEPGQKRPQGSLAR